jgi:excisionase family DNA binding protein
MDETSEPLLTVSDVASRCGVSTATVRRWCADGRLAAVLVGGSWRTTPSELAAMIESGTRKRLDRYIEVERAVPFR